MTLPGLLPPSPITTIDGDDVARLEQWAARQRAELSRLALRLRSARMKADKAEQAERDGPPEVQPTPELLSVLDSMLDKALREADRAVETARCDAAAMVAAEREWATIHLRSLGLDPVVVLGTSGWTVGGIPDVARPVSVGELWHTVEDEARATGSAPATVPAGASKGPSAAVPELVFDDAELFAAFWGDAQDRPASGQGVAAGPARLPPGLAAEAPPPTNGRPLVGAPEPVRVPASRWRTPERINGLSVDPSDRPDGLAPGAPVAPEPETFEVFWGGAEPFDGFWNDADGEQSRRPIRDRLRRRAAQGQP